MAALLDKINAMHPLLWLDDMAYSERLLASGHADWLDTADVVAFRRKATGLLGLDVVVLPVDVVARAWLDVKPELRLAMAAKERAVAPLRLLLADPGFRGKLDEFVRALRAALHGRPVVLLMSSPRKWIGDAYRVAFGEAAQVSIGPDQVDSSAVYVAEFLRTFGESGVDSVLMQEATGAGSRSFEEIAWFQPVINVARHFRWDLGLQFADDSEFVGEVRGLSFAVARLPLPGCVAGLSVPAEFWSGAPPPAVPAGGFLYSVIPADGVPEQVLERIGAFRRDGK